MAKDLSTFEGFAVPSQNIHQLVKRFHIPLSVILAILLTILVQSFVVPQFLTNSTASHNTQQLSQWQLQHFDADLARCPELTENPVQYEFPVPSDRSNPRWNPITGQANPILLRNATLFDGTRFIDYPVDVLFSNGTIKSVTPTSTSYDSVNVLVLNMDGGYVTPGLVDMHSHHLVEIWPGLGSGQDGNEMHPSTGPLTPFLRSFDSMKPYDLATRIIASGGVTSSLVLPGSANIMGGEGFLVKNMIRSGENREDIVEELLLENGVPYSQRRRYMKLAAGENPSSIYGHTRMANAWILRQHLEKAQKLLTAQDGWCLAAKVAREQSEVNARAFLEKLGNLPQSLELESTVALLRGKVGANIHCYEVQDMEDMLRHSKEFGFRIQAFHHALEAWKVPGLLKEKGQNITIATFSTFGLYKQEAYSANLAAGKILAENGVPVAYKSDHSLQELSAKHLVFQAATAHSFGLPEDLALQSVTSVPARSLQIDHRVGFVDAGYDADIVLWDSHPLSIGATPLQVYIDGTATLDTAQVSRSLSKSEMGVDHPHKSSAQVGRIRKVLREQDRSEICGLAMSNDGRITIKGIRKSYLGSPESSELAGQNLTIVLDKGKVLCFDSEQVCASLSHLSKVVTLDDGHVLPGITAYTNNLGLTEIVMEDLTTDGTLDSTLDILNPDNLVFAKYGVHLEGKAFDRAKIGGVTKAITPPFQGLDGSGFLGGVSVGLRSTGERSILDGGIFQDDVALHFAIGQAVKGSKSTPTISTAIAMLRKILVDNKGKDNMYGKAANGSIPVVISVHEKHAIVQLIKLKKDHGSVNLIIHGGAEAPLVAAELANAKIPVIFTSARGAPDTWEKRNTVSGPPLTPSPVTLLVEAGVKFGLAIPGFSDPELFNLIIEASWAAKYSGLSNYDGVSLVSRNIEEIMGLDVDDGKRDFVVWEGDPLRFGASVAFSFDGQTGCIVDCWPEAR